MDSYQNLALLENLYRLKALGYTYCDPITPNPPSASATLPSSLTSLNQSIAQCHLCDLSKSRRQSMIGYGNVHASLMFVDAYVSAAEDETNSYYTGRAGSMLKDMIEKVLHLSTQDVFLTHVVKCKPFGFQIPSQSECQSCFPFLSRQIELISPKIIVVLGEDAYRLLTHGAEDFSQMCGQLIPYGNSMMIPLHHPAFLFRNPSFKKEAMLHLQIIKEAIQ